MRRFRALSGCFWLARFDRRGLRHVLAAGLIWLTPPLFANAAAAPPSVVVSIPPLHSLTSMVMEGVAVPDLLLKGGASPHSYALRPSESRRLADAELVIWVGDTLEVFLRKPLKSLAGDAKILSVARLDTLERLRTRDGGAWSMEADDSDQDDHKGHGHDHEHGHGHGHGHGAHDDGTDPHLWLTTRNARVIVAAIAARLAAIDPANAARYRRNAATADTRLAALAAELNAQLAPVRAVPFIVLHDAWQYFEHQFGLKGVGAISVSPERPPGARRLVALRARLAETGARCVFSEPQFSAAVVGTLIRGTTARTAVLDPLGAELPPGPGLYPRLMRDMAQTLVDCLGSAPG